MIPLDPTINVTRSFSFKLGLPSYSSADFFMSAGTQCPESQAIETADRLYRLCYDQISADVAAYRSGMQAPAEIADEVLHPERAQAPEVSPFRVTQAAPVAEPDNVASAPAGSSNLDAVQTKEPMPEPVAPARRGRKAQQTSGIDAAQKPVEREASTHEATTVAANVKSPDQFQADDSDLPKVLGGSLEVTPGPDLKAKHEAIRAAEAVKAAGPQLVPKPARSQVERLGAIEATLAKDGKRTPDNIHAAVGAFMKAFLNTPEKLKKPPQDAYEPIVPIIERIVETNPGLIMADPAKAGLEAGAGWSSFVRHIDKWRPELKEAATAAVLHKFPDNAMDLLDFLHNIAKLGELDKNLYVFLRTITATNAAVAMTLKATSDEHNKPMAEIMDGLDFDTATEGDILARISGVTAKTEPGKTAELWIE